MNKQAQLINERYEALLFARTPEAGRKAAQELIKVVMGEEALLLPFEEALRQTCRKFRPSKDPREQARFEEEFLEFANWPGNASVMAAA